MSYVRQVCKSVDLIWSSVFSRMSEIQDLINDTKKIVEEIYVDRANFLMMAYYLCEIGEFLQKCSRQEEVFRETCLEECLLRLAQNVESVCSFVKRCRTNSRVLLLYQSSKLTVEMKSRMMELAECLEGMIEGNGEIWSGLVEEVKGLLNKLTGAEFISQPEHEKIARSIDDGLKMHKEDKEFVTDILKEISVRLNVPYSEARELVIELQRNLELARVEGRDSDVVLLQELVLFFESAVFPDLGDSLEHQSSSLSDDLSIPSSFFCPITRQIMVEPQQLAETGHTYERYAILKWFEGEKKTCPSTGRELENFELIPNVRLKQNIEEFFDRKRHKQLLQAIQQIKSQGPCVEEAVNTIKNILDIDQKYKSLLVTFDGVGPLVSILKPQEQLREKIYRILFSIATLGEAYKALIIKAGAVPILLRILQKNPAANGGPVQLLWELSKCEHGKKSILEEKASVVFIAMAFNLCTNDQKLQAKKLLDNLCEHDKSAIALAASSGVYEPLVSKLSSGDHSLQMEMLQTISDVGPCGKSLQSLINAGAIPALIKILEHGMLDAQLLAAKALKLLSRSDVNKVAILEHASLPVLIQSVSTEEQDLSLEILEILSNLATDKPSAGRIEQGGVINCLIEILKVEYCKLHETALKILACLSKDSRTIRRSLVEANIVPNLYRLLQDGKNENKTLSSNCCLSILNIISYLAEDRDTRSAIAKPESFVAYFIENLKATSLSADEKEANLLILAAMAKLDETKRDVVSDGYLQQICIDCLKSDRAKIQECAIVIITKLTDPNLVSSKSVPLNLAKRGLIPLLKDILKQGTERAKQHAAVTLGQLSMRTPMLTERPSFIKKILAKMGFSRFRICKVHSGKCSSKGTLCLVESEIVLDLINLIKDGRLRSSHRAMEALHTLIENKNKKLCEAGVDYLVEKGIITHLVHAVGHNEKSTERAVMMLERIFKCKKYRSSKYAALAKQPLYSVMGTGNQFAIQALVHLGMVPKTSTYTKTD